MENAFTVLGRPVGSWIEVKSSRSQNLSPDRCSWIQ